MSDEPHGFAVLAHFAGLANEQAEALAQTLGATLGYLNYLDEGGEPVARAHVAMRAMIEGGSPSLVFALFTSFDLLGIIEEGEDEDGDEVIVAGENLHICLESMRAQEVALEASLADGGDEDDEDENAETRARIHELLRGMGDARSDDEDPTLH